MIEEIFSINPQDRDKLDWAYTYLKNQNYSDLESPGMEIYRYLDMGEVSNEYPPSVSVLLIRMRDAWRQKIHREKQKAAGMRASSFTLSNELWEKLEGVAKATNSPLNKTLERIIEEAHLKQSKRTERKTKENQVKNLEAGSTLQARNSRTEGRVQVRDSRPENKAQVRDSRPENRVQVRDPRQQNKIQVRDPRSQNRVPIQDSDD